MATTNQPSQSTVDQPQAVGMHATDKGLVQALGISNKRLNTNAHDLQERMEYVRDDFLEVRSSYIGRERHDFLANGLLGEIVARTPIFVYDLPQLKRVCHTAFVDKSGKMYIADTFARRLLAEHDQGKDSLNFLIRHEADHLRRLHLARMVKVPHDIANVAQDTRINIDLVKAEAGARLEAAGNSSPNKEQLQEAAKAYLTELSTTAVGIGVAMNIEDYIKFDGLSEEAIAAILLKDWKEPPKLPNRDVSFDLIMEGAAQEADNVKVMLQSGAKLAPTPPPNAMTPAELSGLAGELRRIGKAKANPKQVSDKDLQSAHDLLERLTEHQGLLELDTQHDKAAMALVGTGGVHSSGKTGDVYLDALRPSERVEMARMILEKILNPSCSNGSPPNPQGGLTIKDLERAMGRGGKPNPGQGQSQQGTPQDAGGEGGDQDQSKGDPDMVPMPNVMHGQDHVMSTEELVKVLNSAGVSKESMEKLGYDDLDKLEDEQRSCKDGLVAAINKASEDEMRLGNRYPGGHMLHYAKAQMLDFFKPVLSWEMAYKKVMESVGKGQRYDELEPWTIYNVDAADMGFKHQRDVPFMGSMVPGKLEKPLFLSLHDTSGSVDDAMLKRFISEGINMSRKMSRGVAPDVVHVFADTVARGEPLFITERNYKDILAKGIDYGGRGGTNLHASIEHAFELVKPGSRKPYSGRKIEALAYFTDLGDSVPDPRRLLAKALECGMKKLPTILFIAPKMCFSDHFNKEVSKWAQVVYFDSGPGATAKTKIDINAAERAQEAKMAGIAPERKASAKP